MSSPAGLNLSLPGPSSGLHTPSTPGVAPKRKRKVKHVNRDLNRALDENDDISDEEILEVPASRRRRLEEDYDDDDDDEPEAGVEVDEDDQEDDEDEEGDDEEEEGGDEDAEVDGGGNSIGIGASRAGRAVKSAGKKVRLAPEHVKAMSVEKRDKKLKGDRIKLRSILDPEQTARFDAFGTAFIPKTAITRLNREMFDQRVHPNITALIAGMAKVFVADIVELAKDLQPNSAHPTGPLRPYHLRLARSILEERGVLRRSGEARARQGLFRR